MHRKIHVVAGSNACPRLPSDRFPGSHPGGSSIRRDLTRKIYQGTQVLEVGGLIELSVEIEGDLI